MLKVPILDDLSFETLVRRAKGRIPSLTADWTDFNEHDPGVTTLQTLAWLTDTLNYYIDATGEAHRLSTLRLLGLRPERAAARCLVALSAPAKREIAIARGAKLSAGDTVFEAAEGYCAVSNRMTALFEETDGIFTELTRFAGVDGEYAAVFYGAPAHAPAVYFGFEGVLGDTFRFYADFADCPGRNAFSDDFCLVRLAWDFYDGKGWRAADVQRDETHGFLNSGYVALSLPGRAAALTGHPVLPEAYYLRARPVEGAYDVPPRIGNIYPDCIEAVQTETLSRAVELTYGGSLEIALDYHVRETDVVRVAAKEQDGYSLWYGGRTDESSLCEVVTGPYPWQRVIRFDPQKFGAVPREGQGLLAIITDAGFNPVLGTTAGYAREQLDIEVDNLYELRIATLEERGDRPFFRLWNECESLDAAPPDGRVFELDRSAGRITFGDGRCAAQPGPRKAVLAVTAKTSLLDAGNVLAKRIHLAADRADGVSATNPGDASGGKRAKTSVELERELEDRLAETTRAVTAEDYAKIVAATPGLIIGDVNVFSGAQYLRIYGGAQKPNTVMIAVTPRFGSDKRPALSDAYRRRIREHLERYRLLVIDVKILAAKYVGIEADGRILLTENTPLARQRVERELAGLIEASGEGRFGKSLIYGRIFSKLELLDCVAKVSELSFSCTGEGARKNEQGDIVVYPDAIACLDRISIEFV